MNKGLKRILALSIVVMMLFTLIPNAFASGGEESTVTIAESGGTYTMTIDAKAGDPLTAADFVIDGTDYSLYNWTYEVAGVSTPLNIQSLIGVDNTTIEAIGDGTLYSTGLSAVSNHLVNFYIYIDGERTLLKSQYVTSYYITNRHYLSAASLESVYGEYGFNASDLVLNTRFFPHANYNEAKIWADAPVVEVDGRFFSPITTGQNTTDVYYLPNQTLTGSNAPWVNFKQTESFYRVVVEDSANHVYSTLEQLPGPSYTKKGGDVSVTVKNPSISNVIWKCVGTISGTPKIGTDNGDGTSTFSISGINEPYTITAAEKDGTTIIGYSINRPEIPSDMEYECPTIMGMDNYNITAGVGEDAHTVIPPSITSFFYLAGGGSGSKYLGKAEFLGWAINGDTDPAHLITPGTTLNLAEYNGVISLEAQWKTGHANSINKTGSMVNFFVSTYAHPEGITAWIGAIPSAKFTDSVYTSDCGVDASDVPTNNLHTSFTDNQYFVLGGTSGTDISVNHNEIVSNLTNGFSRNGFNFKVSFPTDEQALQKIRQMINSNKVGDGIKINGHTITADEMNTENFTIKWYVFKYDTSDGWHIDGVLTAKTGKMIVNKTFAGDADAIDEIKDNYSITVSGETGTINTGGILELDTASYDPSTETYTWEIPVDQYYNYTVTENNYLSSIPDETTIAKYGVRNSKYSSQNTGGWQSYNSGITVTGQSHLGANSEQLTVNFINTYVPPGVLVLQKVDESTGYNMSDISFDVFNASNVPLTLYHRGSGQYALSDDGHSTPTTKVTTDFSGQAYLELPEGTYRFRESLPEGYDDPGYIDVVMALDPLLNKIKIESVISNIDGKFVTKNDNVLEMTAKNHSKTINLKVKKIWEDGENKPVTIQLYHKGEAIRDPVVLDGVTDAKEITAWEYTYDDIPLYIDGERAEYTIREERIGDFLYSAAYPPDGYRYYSAVYSDIEYFNELGNPTSDTANAESAVLSVTNSRNTANLAIQKVDEYENPLSGAEFKLYSADGASGTPPGLSLAEGKCIKTVVSNIGGIVDFGNIPEGDYYLKESITPAGYQSPVAPYKLNFSNGLVTIEGWDTATSSWVVIPNNKLVNIRNKTDVEITKTVSGSMGDKTKLFSFSVRCTERMQPDAAYTLSADGLTANFSLSHDKNITLKGVPVGAKLTITETNNATYDDMIITVAGNPLTNPVTVVENMEITVNNNKDGTPDAGVLLDSLPYIIILAVVIVIAVLMLIRKRFDKNDD